MPERFGGGGDSGFSKKYSGSLTEAEEGEVGDTIIDRPRPDFEATVDVQPERLKESVLKHRESVDERTGLQIKVAGEATIPKGRDDGEAFDTIVHPKGLVTAEDPAEREARIEMAEVQGFGPRRIAKPRDAVSSPIEREPVSPKPKENEATQQLREEAELRAAIFQTIDNVWATPGGAALAKEFFAGEDFVLEYPGAEAEDRRAFYLRAIVDEIVRVKEVKRAMEDARIEALFPESLKALSKAVRKLSVKRGPSEVFRDVLNNPLFETYLNETTGELNNRLQLLEKRKEVIEKANTKTLYERIASLLGKGKNT